MSRRASPTLIGAFVVGALALTVVALVLFGSGRFFQKTYPFVCYFGGDVNGLSIGAPVKFKGVEIGSVTRIGLKFMQPGDIRIPVYIQLDASKIEATGVMSDFSPAAIRQAVYNGLRAQLETQSLVTGLLFVQLDFHPDTPVEYGGAGDGITEIPTVPTTIEQVQHAIKDIIQRLDQVDFKKIAQSLDDLVVSATSAAQSIAKFVDSPELKEALVSVDQALDKVGDLASGADREIGPLVKSFTATSEQTQQALDELEGTLKQTRSMLAVDSPLTVEVTRALQEITSAARALRQFADQLQRDPSALVRGRDIQK